MKFICFCPGVYDQDAPEELLLATPALYRQGRLGTVYQPASFWIVMADSVYQSIVIFFITLGVNFFLRSVKSDFYIDVAHKPFDGFCWN